MFNKSLIVCTVFLAFQALPAFAGATFGDISNVNSDLKLQDLRNKLIEAKLKDPTLAHPATSTEAASAKAPDVASKLGALPVPEESIALVSVYGIGKKLSAEIRYNGVVQTHAAVGSSSRLGPWQISEITPYHVVLTKKIGKSKHAASTGEVTKELVWGTDTPPPESAKKEANNSPMTFPNLGAMMGATGPQGGLPSMAPPPPAPMMPPPPAGMGPRTGNSK